MSDIYKLRWAILANEPFPEDVGNEVIGAMCSGIFDDFYIPRSLEGIVYNAELVNNYFEIERIIQGHK